MFEFLARLFNTSGFMPRWNCGDWTSGHGWLHIGSDLAIGGAYAAIPLLIAFFVVRRRDVTFPKLYWLFAIFIFSCGLGHLVEATLFWEPWYRFSGVVKLATACASWATVLVLYRYMPLALTLPAAARLNEQLKTQVAERTRAEAVVIQLNTHLKHRIEELETLLDVLPIGIGIAIDPQCLKIRSNAAFARLLRLPHSANASLSAPDSEAPRNFRVFANGRELTPAELPIQAAAAGDRTIKDFEEEIVFSDGERVPLLASAAPLHDEQNRVRGAVGVFVDISERRRVEDDRLRVERKLQEAQKLESLGVLAGGIAHDFNNLLTGVIGNASLARLQLGPSSARLGYLEQIETAAVRAAELCKQMLAYSGRSKFHIEKIDVNRVIADTTYLLQTSISKKAALKFGLAENLPPISADPSQIRQIIMNLVINASEAIGDRSGIISLATGLVRADRAYLDTTITAPDLPEGDYVYIEVSDSGCGMSPETLTRIFDPFFTTKFTGRGLGLAAVLGIVRGHKGAIKVYSEVGRGTNFKLIFPCVEGVAFETPRRESLDGGWRGAGVALVVDDEEIARTVTARMLEFLGFVVLVAADGAEGLAILRERREQMVVVLLDLTMPRLDGEQTFREMRLIQPDVRVLLMSGFNEQDAINRFTGKGLAGFLQKPFNLEELRERVKVILV